MGTCYREVIISPIVKLQIIENELSQIALKRREKKGLFV